MEKTSFGTKNVTPHCGLMSHVGLRGALGRLIQSERYTRDPHEMGDRSYQRDMEIIEGPDRGGHIKKIPNFKNPSQMPCASFAPTLTFKSTFSACNLPSKISTPMSPLACLAVLRRSGFLSRVALPVHNHIHYAKLPIRHQVIIPPSCYPQTVSVYQP
jgi:hypothetical protein